MFLVFEMSAQTIESESLVGQSSWQPESGNVRAPKYGTDIYCAFAGVG